MILLSPLSEFETQGNLRCFARLGFSLRFGGSSLFIKRPSGYPSVFFPSFLFRFSLFSVACDDFLSSFPPGLSLAVDFHAGKRGTHALIYIFLYIFRSFVYIFFGNLLYMGKSSPRNGHHHPIYLPISIARFSSRGALFLLLCDLGRPAHFAAAPLCASRCAALVFNLATFSGSRHSSLHSHTLKLFCVLSLFGKSLDGKSYLALFGSGDP